MPCSYQRWWSSTRHLPAANLLRPQQARAICFTSCLLFYFHLHNKSFRPISLCLITSVVLLHSTMGDVHQGSEWEPVPVYHPQQWEDHHLLHHLHAVPARVQLPAGNQVLYWVKEGFNYHHIQPLQFWGRNFLSKPELVEWSLFWRQVSLGTYSQQAPPGHGSDWMPSLCLLACLPSCSLAKTPSLELTSHLDLSSLCDTFKPTFLIYHIMKKQSLSLILKFPALDTYTQSIYRVVINERHNVLHYCDPILSPGYFLSLLGAYQIWSIW